MKKYLRKIIFQKKTTHNPHKTLALPPSHTKTSIPILFCQKAKYLQTNSPYKSPYVVNGGRYSGPNNLHALIQDVYLYIFLPLNDPNTSFVFFCESPFTIQALKTFNSSICPRFLESVRDPVDKKFNNFMLYVEKEKCSHYRYDTLYDMYKAVKDAVLSTFIIGHSPSIDVDTLIKELKSIAANKSPLLRHPQPTKQPVSRSGLAHAEIASPDQTNTVSTPEKTAPSTEHSLSEPLLANDATRPTPPQASTRENQSNIHWCCFPIFK